MFTGLISNLGRIISIVRSNSSVWQLKIESSLFPQAKIGDSIAINGCCLTVIDVSENIATFTLMLETLNLTTFAQKSASEQVHVERSASLRDLIEGHQVTGHICGIIILQGKEKQSDGSMIMTFTLPEAQSLLTYKGSVAIDGVSLTVSELSSNSFSVSLIPHTQNVTLLTKGKIGSAYNFEAPNWERLFASIHLDFMGLAREKSLLGRITAPSNPWVGAVITDKAGNVRATGYHRKRGEKHAEVDALSKLSPEEVKTEYVLYCTLEPCNHTGLQPPCTDAIIKSGIRKVVVGILDPDARVSGSGINRLRETGIEVIILHDQRIATSLKSYIFHRQTKRPYVTLKMAMSLDGKIAPGKLSSQFPISGPESREHCHVLRLKSQAILVGTNTALLDQPQLNVRLPENSKYFLSSQEHRPLRCFLDIHGKVIQGPLLETSVSPTLVFTNRETCNKATLRMWKEKGLQVVFLSLRNGKLLLSEILDELGKRGVLDLLVEGGAQLFTSFVEENLANRLVLYLAPIFLGRNGICLFDGEISQIRYKQEKVKTLGNDVILTYRRIDI